MVITTEDHPFYIKKQDGKTGGGAICPNKKATRLKSEPLKLVIGDKLLNSDEEWIEVTKITYHLGEIQTYNILSLSGRKNYFANGVLVYEEFPRIPYLILFQLKTEKHPLRALIKIILQGKIDVLP